MVLEKVVGFWVACHQLRKGMPVGWVVVPWPGSDSNMTIKRSGATISVENDRFWIKRHAAESRAKRERQVFHITVTIEGEGEPHVFEVSTEELFAKVHSLATEIESIKGVADPVQLPKEAAAPKLKSTVPKSARVKETKPTEVAPLRLIEVPVPPVDPFPIGAHVRIVSGAYPALMKGVIQRIDARRVGSAQVTRWYSRKNRKVSAWVPLENLVIVAESEVPRDTCQAHGPNKEKAAPDSFKRGWCKICPFQTVCPWYSQKIMWVKEKEA